jgi:AraC-like DNA-binding protein
MKILYKQPKNSHYPILDISNCYFKQINYSKLPTPISCKIHHHAEYEIHLVMKGLQTYSFYEKDILLTKNMFIIIPPRIKHRAIDMMIDTQKYVFTFEANYVPGYSFFVGTIDETILQNLRFIIKEQRNALFYSNEIIGNRISETILLLLRTSGYKEAQCKQNIDEPDDRLILAKKYIDDNINHVISVADVASYCRLSPRHLTRIFIMSEGIPLSKYIQQIKMEAVKEDIRWGELSMKEISEKYSYNSEYYFNRAFKAYFGMPPGAYRQMLKSNKGS